MYKKYEFWTLVFILFCFYIQAHFFTSVRVRQNYNIMASEYDFYLNSVVTDVMKGLDLLVVLEQKGHAINGNTLGYNWKS